MTKKFDILVYIGRFQPFHLGHMKTVELAMKQADTVLVFTGSANKPRSPKNPWSAKERREMILKSFGFPVYSHNISWRLPPLIVTRLNDVPGIDEEWASNVTHVANLYGNKIGIIGHSKDESSYYLKLFPKWEYIEVPLFNDIHATDIREEYFGLSKTGKEVVDLMPEAVYNYLLEFKETKYYMDIWGEVYDA